ncbi:hypothetical protein [Streptomyces sp. NBC_01500]|uniref:hypothetical protein n=1 Tax=Streptomyces sp. NBC_01500 TaxID=2903886 RepID=UPI002258CDAE|nr:hypothetical protein [Streptomyces sp. NBC_01500]MCX4554289.1 hypothetical protein [Streptomyces sp. NBC_01500]
MRARIMKAVATAAAMTAFTALASPTSPATATISSKSPVRAGVTGHIAEYSPLNLFSADHEPCRIKGASAAIRVRASASAPEAGVAYHNQKCIFHGYDRAVRWARITMKKTKITGWVRSTLISTAKEELAPTGP